MAPAFGPRTSGSLIDFSFVPDLSRVESDLLQLAGSLNNFKAPLTRSVREVMVPSIRTNFATGGRPAWTPLAQSTIDRGKQGSILVETGRLETVATQFSRWSIGQSDAFVSNFPSNVAVRAAVHQGGAQINFAGGERKTRHSVGKKGSRRVRAEVKPYGVSIPARPFMMIQSADSDRIAEIFAEWLDDKLSRGFGRR